jgi:hypothetical protein
MVVENLIVPPLPPLMLTVLSNKTTTLRWSAEDSPPKRERGVWEVERAREVEGEGEVEGAEGGNISAASSIHWRRIMMAMRRGARMRGTVLVRMQIVFYTYIFFIS